MEYTNQIKALLATIVGIKELCNKRTISVISIAGKLGINSRTLQRRLLEEGTNYSEILDSVRREKSEELLKKDITIKDISKMLGFSDRTSYANAHNRWFNERPDTRRTRLGLRHQ